MPRFRLPHGAKNVDMQDGTRYRASGNPRRGATIDVDNPSHAKAIARMGAVEGFVHETGFSAPTGQPSRRCEPCDFTGFKFQHTCPRCGAPMALTEAP